MAIDRSRVAALRAAADAHVKPLSLLMLQAVGAGRKALPLAAIEAALAAGRASGVLRAAEPAVSALRSRLEGRTGGKAPARKGLAKVLADAQAAGGAAGRFCALNGVPVPCSTSGSVRVSFDEMNPAAFEWAGTRSAALVTEVTASTREAIRAIVQRAFAEGLPPREAAKLIRDVIGLTSRDARAVQRRYEAAIRGGLSPQAAQDAAKRYADQLHRRRALVIARTETIAASNAGQQELWRQAVEAKQLKKSQRKAWIATGDERTCPQCGPMDGQTVPVLESFSLGDPPAHPLCRCTTGLVT